ncbi:hypothetical protein GQ53DRAFT_460056 [Thozetella sp. PMI_491]|nr:hypothetical protein GQ53DRAFT_460056 [Thozetella sp. PMI_491]
MCGPDTPSGPREGARVDFFSRARGALGNLVFLDPAAPNSSVATHVRFTPGDGVALSDSVLVSIHVTGDMTKPVQDCGLLHQFRLSRALRQASGFEMPLDKPLSLEIGGAGILGRRVSMLQDGTPSENRFLADGIVGFNSNLPITASL